MPAYIGLRKYSSSYKRSYTRHSRRICQLRWFAISVIQGNVAISKGAWNQILLQQEDESEHGCSYCRPSHRLNFAGSMGAIRGQESLWKNKMRVTTLTCTPVRYVMIQSLNLL